MYFLLGSTQWIYFKDFVACIVAINEIEKRHCVNVLLMICVSCKLI